MSTKETKVAKLRTLKPAALEQVRGGWLYPWNVPAPRITPMNEGIRETMP